VCGGGGLLDSSSQTTLLCYDAAAAYVRRQHLMRSFAEVRYACFPWRCRCLWDSVDMLCQIMSHLHVVRGNRVCNTICGAAQGAPTEMQHDCAVVCPACSCAYFDANASKCKQMQAHRDRVHKQHPKYLLSCRVWRHGLAAGRQM
jgi:hypothetical protein